MHCTNEFKRTNCWIDLNIKKYCSLPYCINNKIINKNLSLFVFPKNKKRCKKWLSGYKRCYLHDIFEKYGTDCLNMCCLCEEHFETSQFTDLTLERLISDAVPTLFQAENLFYQRINQRSSTRIEASPEMQPCSSGSFQNLHQKEKCVQRLMPLFPYLKVYQHRFLHNLPRNLTIRKSNHAGAQYGIWSIEDIPFGTRYGPFDTVVSPPPNLKNKLRVQYFHRTGRQNNVEKPVTGRMTLSINWLQYVNLASNAEQQNLLIYQCQGKVYYLCYKPIPANTELLVWYGPYIEEKKENKMASSQDIRAFCFVCDIAFTKKEEIIHCNGHCQGSFHHACIGMTAASFKKLPTSTKKNWKCKTCKQTKRQLNSRHCAANKIPLPVNSLPVNLSLPVNSLPVNISLPVKEKPSNPNNEDCYSMEEVVKSMHLSPFCNKHRVSAFYSSEMEICEQNLAAILGVEGKLTENELLKLASKELNNLERTSLELSLEKAEQCYRFNILRKHLLSLISPEGHRYNGRTMSGEVKIPSIRSTPQEETYHSIQHLAVVLGVEGRTGKEILDLASLELNHLHEVELTLQEKKSKEERKFRALKRRFSLISGKEYPSRRVTAEESKEERKHQALEERFLLSGKDLKNSSMETIRKYCVMCEHSYSHNLS